MQNKLRKRYVIHSVWLLYMSTVFAISLPTPVFSELLNSCLCSFLSSPEFVPVKNVLYQPSFYMHFHIHLTRVGWLHIYQHILCDDKRLRDTPCK